MAPIPRLLLLYDRLTVIRPKYGYYPEASKSILIVEPKGVARALELTKSLSFKVATGSRYLRGFIGEKGGQTEWIRSKVEKWTEGASQIATLAATHPQQAHIAFTESFQMVWLYLQRVTDEDAEIYVEFENTIKNELLPKLFREDLVDDMRRSLISNPIRHGGAATNKPVDAAPINLRTSEVCTLRISSALMKRSEFNRLYHQKVMTAGQKAAAEAKDAAVILRFETIIAQKPPR